MKVFISSLIAGFEAYRQAAKKAVGTLRHEPIMAEDFGAQPSSPQVACLNELRQSDVVILILGEGYGPVQANSGLSATHEEYREARGQKPVIAFVKSGIVPGFEQAAFIDEVQGWEGGLFRGAFKDPEELQIGITRALHDFELANAVGPVDPQALIEIACGLLPSTGRNLASSAPFLNMAIAPGPVQQILRPAEIEATSLADALHEAALFGEGRFFDPGKGVKRRMKESSLVVEQERGADLQLYEQGSIVLRLPLEESSGADRVDFGSHSVLLEEVVQQKLASALAYSGWLLERIDRTQRLTHVAVAASISGAEHRAWRTKSQLGASPNRISLGSSFNQDRPPIYISISRAVLRLDRSRLVEDLLVPLRRQWSKE